MIFISYRRSDAGGHARSVFNQLRYWFDDAIVFYDHNSIDMGDTFPVEIETALNRATVVLVLIGPGWLKEINDRVDQLGKDFVRLEIELALQRKVAGAPLLIVPVLLGDAAMPLGHQFRDELNSLAPFCALDAHTLGGKQADWDNSFVALRRTLAAQPGVPAPRFRAPAGVEPPYRVSAHSLTPHFCDPNGLLARVRSQLASSGSAALQARAAMHGMGGIGKTQLALKYSQDYRDIYAGVWWFRAETETTLQQDAKDACTAVNAPINEHELPSAAFKRWLATQCDSRWLLVFDNAEDPAALRPHLPDGGQHHLMITSRRSDWGGLARAVELATWTPEQGAEFLATRLPGSTLDERKKLSGDLDGLPLALEQAASYIEATGVTVTEYCRLLAGVDTEGAILDEGGTSTGYERSVIATLSLAFEKLSPAAAQLLRLLAFAAPEPLPERFFHEAMDTLPLELGEAAAQTLRWNAIIAELRRYGLAERLKIPALDRAPGEVSDDTEPALNLHRLTQQTIRARLAQPLEDCLRFEAVLRACCPPDVEHPKHWPRCAALAPHVRHLATCSNNEFFQDSDCLGWLLDRLANYIFFSRGPYGDAENLQRRALAIANECHGHDHPNTLTAMNNLSVILMAQGNLAGAREIQEAVLEAHRRLFGDVHRATLTSMNNLAGTLDAQGDFGSAQKIHESVLAICRRRFGEEHPDTLTSMNNLATTLKAQGDLTGAHTLAESVIETRQRLLGKDHPHTISSMSVFALILEAQGDLPRARELEASVLEARRRVLGDEHPDTLTSMNHMAITRMAQGNYESARELLELALAARNRVCGEDHLDTLTAMVNLASTANIQGDVARARELQKEALAGRLRLLGDDHPDTIGSAWNLFMISYNLRDHATTDDLLRRYLIPLMKADPASLSNDVQAIREQLLKLPANVLHCSQTVRSGNSESSALP